MRRREEEHKVQGVVWSEEDYHSRGERGVISRRARDNEERY